MLARHRRHHRDQKAAAIRAGLREPQLAVPAPVTSAYAAAAVAHARLLIALNEQIEVQEEK